ncbi:transposase [Micromonospora fiedleri]|uniref:Transposase n=2 Tax=Micromonospora TaxID=1873 RepID=A0ABS1UVR3_9ACTN|nr:transposase [Micromonospora fiedleri]GIJ19300.1 hypothetical protein Vgi01_59840 [Micromonospora gifhornensis]
MRGGIARRQLPVGFLPPTTVYDRLRAWAKAGVWQAIHDALRDLVRVYEGRDPRYTGCWPGSANASPPSPWSGPMPDTPDGCSSGPATSCT